MSLDETDRIAQFSAGWWRESQPIINIQECDHCGWTDLGLPLQRKLACRHLHDEEPGVDQKHPDCDNPPDYILQSSGQ